MESVVEGNGGGSHPVMTELSSIKELVKQLDVHLGGCPDLCKHLAAQIVTVTERSIGMIRSGNFDGRKRSASGAGIDSPPFPETPSPLSSFSNMSFKANKKRKMMDKEKHQVRVNSAGGGAETTPVDDGYSWRKYGQKDILGSQHPRGYYRCTYQKSQGCAATKQVQRADEDPTFYDVIYHGAHTCLHKTAAAAKLQPATPNPDARDLLQSLSSSLTVNTEWLTSGPQQSTPFSFSSPAGSGMTAPEHYLFSTPSTPENCLGQGVSLSPSQLELSPATSESSYIQMDPFEADWRAQSELQEMVTAMIAATSMPEPAVQETYFSMDTFCQDLGPPPQHAQSTAHPQDDQHSAGAPQGPATHRLAVSRPQARSPDRARPTHPCATAPPPPRPSALPRRRHRAPQPRRRHHAPQPRRRLRALQPSRAATPSAELLARAEEGKPRRHLPWGRARLCRRPLRRRRGGRRSGRRSGCGG